jgi:hypothetical protein
MKINPSINIQANLLQYEENLSLSKSRYKKLLKSKKNVEKKIRDHFKHHKLTSPRFFIQGSYKMKTMVVKKDGSYDVDLGVYFRRDRGLAPTTIKKHVFEAVSGITQAGAKRLDKCIRVIYQREYNIDIPVYSTDDGEETEHPYLATNKGWEESDPRELCNWFEVRVKRHGSQLLRLVKYFKGWAINSTGRMPSGIAITVWVAENYKKHKRDDVAFYKTAQAIQNTFGGYIECINPATPEDDLLHKLSGNQLEAFETKFEKLVANASKALEQKTEAKALALWKKIFGKNFYLTIY